MVYCIGEALIDLVTTRPGRREYAACAGGAPANCAAAVGKLGGDAAFIGKVGADSFGALLREKLGEAGVDCSRMVADPHYKTSLAFATVDEAGERTFDFYRPATAADLMLSPDEIEDLPLTSGDTLYFGSCCLLPSPTKDAIARAVRMARRSGAIIACDVNLRPALFVGHDLSAALSELLPYADIVKMSEDEFPFVTGKETEKEAAEALLSRSAEIVFITRGARGAAAYTKAGEVFETAARRVNVVDTVGAGDAFTGAVLYSFDGCGERGLSSQNVAMTLDFAVSAATLSTTRAGGITSMPDFNEVKRFLKGELS